MFYDFKPSKKKQTAAARNRLAEKIAGSLLQWQRRWADATGRLAGRLPGKWVKTVFVLAVLTAGGYSVYLFASGVYGLETVAMRESVEKLRQWGTAHLGFPKKASLILQDSLSRETRSDSTDKQHATNH